MTYIQRSNQFAVRPDRYVGGFGERGDIGIPRHRILDGRRSVRTETRHHDRLAGLTPGADGKPPLVTLRADKALPYGQVMAVMGELNHAGFNAISLVTNGSVEAP